MKRLRRRNRKRLIKKARRLFYESTKMYDDIELEIILFGDNV